MVGAVGECPVAAIVRPHIAERFGAANAPRARTGDFDGEKGEVTSSDGSLGCPHVRRQDIGASGDGPGPRCGLDDRITIVTDEGS